LVTSQTKIIYFERPICISAHTSSVTPEMFGRFKKCFEQKLWRRINKFDAQYTFLINLMGFEIIKNCHIGHIISNLYIQ
jgi:hypothetical protein